MRKRRRAEVSGDSLEAVVDRHGPDRRVREHEAHGTPKAQLGHDRLEIAAIGAEPM